MTVEQQQLLIFRGIVASLQPEEQQKVAECKGAILSLLKDKGDTGKIALALVAMEAMAE